MQKLIPIGVTLWAVWIASGLSACSSPHRAAPVIERLSAEQTRKSASNLPSLRPPSTDTIVANGTYTVKKGDTLSRIALDLGQDYREIAAWNKLADPNDIYVGQVLQVQPVINTSQVNRIAHPEIETTDLPDSNLTPTAVSNSAAHNQSLPSRPLLDAKNDVANIVVLPALIPDNQVKWIWPAQGKVIGTFDEVKNKGVDIEGKLGQPILAAASGKVMYAGSSIRGYGNLIIIKHSLNLLSAYAHNKQILVKEGQSIAQGQTIAQMGNSDADKVKLHFEVRYQGKPVDPLNYLPEIDKSVSNVILEPK